MTLTQRQIHYIVASVYSLLVVAASWPVLQLLARLPSTVDPHAAHGLGSPAPATMLVDWLIGVPASGWIPWALHTAATVLLALLCFRRTQSLPAALACAPLFYFSSAHLEAAILLSGIAQSLSLICVLAALLIRPESGHARWLSPLIVTLAGILFHPLAWMTLPLLAWEPRESVKRRRAILIGLTALIAALFTTWAMATGPAMAEWQTHVPNLLSWWFRLIATSYVLLVPAYLGFSWEPVLGFGVLILLIMGLVSRRHRWWTAWVIVFTLPLTGVSPIGTLEEPLQASGLAYHAVAGVAVLVALLLTRVVQAGGSRSTLVIGGLLLGVLLLSAVDHQRRLVNVASFSAHLTELIRSPTVQAADGVRRAMDRGGHEIPRQLGYLKLFFFALENPGPHDPADMLRGARETVPDTDDFYFLTTAYESITADGRQRQIARAEVATWYMEPGTQLNGLLRSAFAAMGVHFLRRDDLSRSESALREALALAPGDQGIVDLLARVLNTDGRPAEAARVLETAIASGNATAEMIQVAGDLRYSTSDYRRAVDLWELLDSMSPRNRMLLAQTWQINLRQPERAIPHWLRVIEQGANVEAYGWLANAYELTEQADRAADWRRRILQEFPDSPIAQQIRGTSP